MADEFQPGICSSGSWWNPARPASVSCSAAIVDASGGGLTWEDPELVDPTKGRSCDESVGSASGSSSVAIQDGHKAQPSNAGPSLIDSTLQMPGFGLSSPLSMDWTTQALLRSSGRAETNFHALLQEDLSSRHYFRQDPSIESNQVQAGAGISMTDPFKDMNHSFLLDQQHLSSNSEGADLGVISRYPLVPPASYGCSSSTVPQGLMFESDAKAQQSAYDAQSVNYPAPGVLSMGYRGSSNDQLLQSSWTKFPQLLKSLPPKQQPSNQLHFANNTSFWNASAASISDGRSGFYHHSAPSRLASQAFEPKPNCSSLTTKSNSEVAQDSSCSSGMKKSGGETPAFKKPRIETPSPLPTFKVRKEKLGDRITALQQLVSPFGKTDTASVLHEAIEYIKFLHDQVGALSTPYLKSGHPMQQHQQMSDKSKDGEGPRQDLRSRGLCLVPISSTYPVASETTADFWHPTFSGTFR